MPIRGKKKKKKKKKSKEFTSLNHVNDQQDVMLHLSECYILSMYDHLLLASLHKSNVADLVEYLN
jgi:hypothetical protein